MMICLIKSDTDRVSVRIMLSRGSILSNWRVRGSAKIKTPRPPTHECMQSWEYMDTPVGGLDTYYYSSCVFVIIDASLCHLNMKVHFGDEGCSKQCPTNGIRCKRVSWALSVLFRSLSVISIPRAGFNTLMNAYSYGFLYVTRPA